MEAGDASWNSIKAGLMAIGTLIASTGWFEVASVEPVVNFIMAVGGMMVTIGSFVWMLKTTWGTKTVTIETAKQPGVMVVNPVTGKTQEFE